MKSVVAFMASIERETRFEMEGVDIIREGNGLFRSFYLRFPSVHGSRPRLFVWFGHPEGEGVLPAVLHIHGGGQTHRLSDVKSWVTRGYAACSYDWTGPVEGRTKVSDLTGMPDGEPWETLQPEQSAMYTRVTLAKTMVQWMTLQPQIDPNRIGVYGISWGGAIAWLLHHYDRRVRTFASVYGCGHHADLDRIYMEPNRPGPWAERHAWNACWDGTTLASVDADDKSPMLMIQATNDFWGWFDAGCETLARLPGHRRSQTFTPNLDHVLDEWAEPTLLQWMDTCLRGGLWPAEPVLRVRVDRGTLLFRVTADERMPVQSVRLCWSWGEFAENPSPGRFWHERWIEASPSAATDIPVEAAGSILYVYADAVYESGIKVSSLPQRHVMSVLGIKPGTGTSRELTDFTDGPDGWHCGTFAVATDPFDPMPAYSFTTDDEGRRALRLERPRERFDLATQKCHDPQWKAPSPTAALRLKAFTDAPGRWECWFYTRPQQVGQCMYKKVVTVEPGWRTMEIVLTDWTDEQGRTPLGWGELHRLRIVFFPAQAAGGGNPALSRVWWQEKEEESNGWQDTGTFY